MPTKSTHFRIYCGAEDHDCERFIVQWWNPYGFTLTHCDGYWMGSHENSIVIDYIAHDYGNGIDPHQVVNTFAKDYCKKFGENCVGVSWTSVEWRLVDSHGEYL